MQRIHITTAYTNPDAVDTELGKEITAGWIINDHINVTKAKIDLKSLIPVRAVDWVHLGMDRTCFPFGLRSSLSLINNYADALHWIMASNYGAQLLHYLDDFLLVGPPGKDTCQEAMYRVLLVCAQLSISVASEKLKGPITTLTFLGIMLDTSAQHLCLDPWQAGTADRSWLSKHKATKRDCQGGTSSEALPLPPDRPVHHCQEAPPPHQS